MVLGNVSPSASTILTEITANNLEMTDGMRDHVRDKIGAPLERYKSTVHRCETHLSVNRNPRVADAHCCEAVAFARDGHVVRAEERTSNMYASIDLVGHKLARKLRKLKERKFKKRDHHSFRDDPDVLAKPDYVEEEEAQVKSPPVVPVIDNERLVRRKKFPMPPQSVDDAVTAIDFLDHDFYVFKNKDTDKINVLYKRREGGLGLIEPDDDDDVVES